METSTPITLLIGWLAGGFGFAVGFLTAALLTALRDPNAHRRPRAPRKAAQDWTP